MPFTSAGPAPGDGDTWLLPNVVGPAAARDLLLTGRVVDADEALRLGLVSRALPREQVLAEVLAAADRVAASAPIATRLTVAALRDGGHATSCRAQWEALAQSVTLATHDLHEGIEAAAQRRPPVFRGR